MMPTLPNFLFIKPRLVLACCLGLAMTGMSCQADNSHTGKPTESGLLETRNVNIKKAVQPASDEIKRNPNSPMGYCKRARQYSQLGMYREAIKDYTKAIELNKNGASSPSFVYQMRGYCLVQIGDFQGGIEDFSSALSTNPQNGAALHNRAAAYDKIGKHKLAQLDRIALKKIHFSPESCQQINYARYLMHNGEYTRALGVYERKIKEEPNNTFAYMGRAQCFHKLNQPDKALADIKKLESMKGTFLPCTLLKATILLESEKMDECIATCTKELVARPDNAALQILNARAHKAKGDYKQAISDYSNAIRVEPQNTDNYLARAQLYEKVGDLDRALNDCSFVVAHNKNDAAALCTRALLFRKLNDDQKALKDLSSAIRINPKDEFLYARRAEIYYRKKLLSQALKDYETAKVLDPANQKYYETYANKIREEVSHRN